MNEVKILITSQYRSGNSLGAPKKELADLETQATKVQKSATKMNEELVKGFPKFSGSLVDADKAMKAVVKSTDDFAARLQKLTPQAEDFSRVSLGVGVAFKQAMDESGAAVDELVLHMYKASRELGDSLYTGLRLDRVHAGVSVVTDRVGVLLDALAAKVSAISDDVGSRAGTMLDAAIAPFQRGRDRLIQAAEDVAEAWEEAADTIEDAMVSAGNVVASLWMTYVQRPLLRTKDIAVATSKTMADAVVHGMDRAADAGVSSAKAVADAVESATAPFRTFGSLAVAQAERAAAAFWAATAPVRAFGSAVADAAMESAKLAGKVAAPFGKVGDALVKAVGDAGSRAGQAALDRISGVFGRSKQKVQVDVEVNKDRFAASLDNLNFDFGGTKFASALDFGRAAGAAVKEGLASAFASASSTLPKLLNPAGMTALVAGAAALGTLAGGALAGGITLGLGAGIAGIGLVAAGRSGEVRSAFARLAREAGAELTEIAAPFRQSLVGMIDQSRFEFGRLKPILKDAFADAAPAVQSFGENLVRAFARFGTAVKPITDGFTAVLDDLGPRLPGLIERISASFGRLADSVEENPEALGDFIDTVGTFVIAMTETVRILNEGYAGVRKFLSAMAGIDVIDGKATASKDALNAMAAAAENGVGPARALQDAIKEVGAAGDDTAAKADGLRRSLDFLAGQTPDYTDALAEAADAISSLDGAFKSADDKAKGFAGSLLNSSGAFDVTNENGRLLYQNVRDVQDAFTNMGAAVQDGQMSREQFIADAGRMRDRLNETWRQAGLNEEQIASLNEQYRLTPEQIATMVRLLGAQDAEATLNRMTRAREAVVYIRQQVSTYGGYVGTGMNGQPIFHDRAHGGIVAAFAHGGVVSRAAAGGVRSSNVVVNDWGSQSHGEAIRLPQGSTVIPASMTRSMESRWGTDRGAGQLNSGPRELRWIGPPDIIQWLKTMVRENGGDASMFGGG